MKISQASWRMGLLSGLLYLALLMGAHMLGGLESDVPTGWPFDKLSTWSFRLFLVAGVALAIVRTRQQQNNQIRPTQALVAGAVATLIFMACAVFTTVLFREVITPDFNEVTRLQYEAYQRTAILHKSPDIDPKKIDQLLESHAYFFTTTGAVIIDLGASFLWGLFATGTGVVLSMINPNAKKND